VNTWFVGTANRLPREAQFSFIWTMAEFETEAAARRYAKDALNRGLRVEAGTLPGPQVRIRWREAVSWAASEEAGRRSAGEASGESRRGSTISDSSIGGARWFLT
jgi:hypothetical protein